MRIHENPGGHSFIEKEVGDGEKELRQATGYLADEWLRGTRVIRFIMHCVLAYFIVVNSQKAYLQHNRLERCSPIEVEIIYSSKRHKKADGKYSRAGWEPIARFKYSVADTTYKSDWLTSMRETKVLTRKQANRFIADHPRGKKVQAYYLPHRPEIAFLLRHVSFIYCRFISGCSVALCFLLWLRLEDDSKDKYRFWKCLALCIYWFVVGFVCYGYYFQHASRPYSVGVILRCVIYFILGAFFLWQLFYSKFYLLPRDLRWRRP